MWARNSMIFLHSPLHVHLISDLNSHLNAHLNSNLFQDALCWLILLNSARMTRKNINLWVRKSMIFLHFLLNIHLNFHLNSELNSNLFQGARCWLILLSLALMTRKNINLWVRKSTISIQTKRRPWKSKIFFTFFFLQIFLNFNFYMAVQENFVMLIGW